MKHKLVVLLGIVRGGGGDLFRSIVEIYYRNKLRYTKFDES